MALKPFYNKKYHLGMTGDEVKNALSHGAQGLFYNKDFTATWDPDNNRIVFTYKKTFETSDEVHDLIEDLYNNYIGIESTVNLIDYEEQIRVIFGEFKSGNIIAFAATKLFSSVIIGTGIIVTSGTVGAYTVTCNFTFTVVPPIE